MGLLPPLLTIWKLPTNIEIWKPSPRRILSLDIESKEFEPLYNFEDACYDLNGTYYKCQFRSVI